MGFRRGVVYVFATVEVNVVRSDEGRRSRGQDWTADNEKERRLENARRVNWPGSRDSDAKFGRGLNERPTFFTATTGLTVPRA